MHRDTPPGDASTCAVHLRGVRFAWPGRRSVSMEVAELRLPRACNVLLRGASGSGKSTLLALIGGLLQAEEGCVEVLGTRLEALSSAARDRFRAAHLGIVFQQFNLLPYLSVLDNVLLPLRFNRSPMPRAQRLRDATALLEALGLGAACVHQPVTRLSVGQQQRVAVARALIPRPALILADEPTSALDADTRDDFLSLLFEQAAAQQCGILLVSHDAGIAERFQQRLDIEDVVRFP